MVLTFFLLLVSLASSLDFLFGRIVGINIFIRVRATDPPPAHLLIFEQSQYKAYREVLIAGDLSSDDIAGANVQYQAFTVSLL